MLTEWKLSCLDFLLRHLSKRQFAFEFVETPDGGAEIKIKLRAWGRFVLHTYCRALRTTPAEFVRAGLGLVPQNPWHRQAAARLSRL